MSTLHLTDGQVFTSAQACIFDPSEHSQCGEYRLTDEAEQWCSEHGVSVILRHWPDESLQMIFPSYEACLLFCIRWDLTWALGK